LKLFSSAIALKNLGWLLCHQPLVSKKDLKSYQWFAVKERVMNVISQLLEIPQAHQSFNIEFENHVNTLSNNAEEVVQHTQQ